MNLIKAYLTIKIHSLSFYLDFLWKILFQRFDTPFATAFAPLAMPLPTQEAAELIPFQAPVAAGAITLEPNQLIPFQAPTAAGAITLEPNHQILYRYL